MNAPLVPFNAWDSFVTKDFLPRPLFDSRNLGINEVCNLQMPASVGAPMELQIEHVYARTADAPRELVHELVYHRWASYVAVLVFVGGNSSNCIQRRMTLADLLQERPWEPTAVAEHRASVSGVAREAYEARVRARRAAGPLPVIVPAGMPLYVHVEGPNDAVQAMIRAEPEARIWIHLEGCRVGNG